MRFRRRTLELAGLLVASVSMLTAAAKAETTLTVDLSNVLRPATHVGNGSLYGVTEQLPADAMGLIAPLHPNMFTNPAADVQQPQGDAIVVAGRVAALGARVTIRLADWFPGWYSFTNMNDWLDKMSQTVSRKQAARLTNVYAYEIWNEPNGTWKSDKPLPFNEFWRQSYVKLRQLEPNEKITGPSLAGYDGTFMRDFLSFCKINDCLPDIVGWHDGDGISKDVQAYRALEKQLGIGPLPITINEYSGSGRLDDEGRPGASAPLIAQLERSGVDTACITYWDVPHPGRLGSLLATDTQPNGGWFFYEWYGELTGNMVATTSSLPVDGKNLDGVASRDDNAKTAFAILGGVNDGSIKIVVKGFSAAALFGDKVHATVERTPFTSRSTVVTATDVLSSADVAVVGDQIAIAIGSANGNDGYRLSLSALREEDGGAGHAGHAGQAAAAGVGGAAAAGSGGNVSRAGSAGASVSSDAGAPSVAGSSGTSTVTPAAGALAPASNASSLPMSNAAGAVAAAPAANPAGCSCGVARGANGLDGRGALASLALLALALGRRRTTKRDRGPS